MKNTIEQINGLLSVKPGNVPLEGETRTLLIEHRPARDGKKAWIKIKNASANFGGSPYRILSANPTGYVDTHGNISFNVEIEPVNGGDATCQEAGQSATTPTSRSSNAAPTSEPESAAISGVDETRRHLMQSANLLLLCINAAKYIAEQMPEQADTAEQRQSLIAQLFIESSHKRTNDGINWWSYIDKLPSKPIK